MPRFVVERPLPNIGDASREEQLSMLRVSNQIVARLGADRIRWIESVFTCDKAYCFYEARDAETIREFSRAGGFPFDKISEVRYVLDPTALGEPGGGDAAD